MKLRKEENLNYLPKILQGLKYYQAFKLHLYFYLPTTTPRPRAPGGRMGVRSYSFFIPSPVRCFPHPPGFSPDEFWAYFGHLPLGKIVKNKDHQDKFTISRSELQSQMISKCHGVDKAGIEIRPPDVGSTHRMTDPSGESGGSVS